MRFIQDNLDKAVIMNQNIHRGIKACFAVNENAFYKGLNGSYFPKPTDLIPKLHKNGTIKSLFYDIDRRENEFLSMDNIWEILETNLGDTHQLFYIHGDQDNKTYNPAQIFIEDYLQYSIPVEFKNAKNVASNSVYTIKYSEFMHEQVYQPLFKYFGSKNIKTMKDLESELIRFAYSEAHASEKYQKDPFWTKLEEYQNEVSKSLNKAYGDAGIPENLNDVTQKPAGKTDDKPKDDVTQKPADNPKDPHRESHVDTPSNTQTPKTIWNDPFGQLKISMMSAYAEALKETAVRHFMLYDNNLQIFFDSKIFQDIVSKLGNGDIKVADKSSKKIFKANAEVLSDKLEKHTAIIDRFRTIIKKYKSENYPEQLRSKVIWTSSNNSDDLMDKFVIDTFIFDELNRSKFNGDFDSKFNTISKEMTISTFVNKLNNFFYQQKLYKIKTAIEKQLGTTFEIVDGSGNDVGNEYGVYYFRIKKNMTENDFKKILKDKFISVASGYTNNDLGNDDITADPEKSAERLIRNFLVSRYGKTPENSEDLINFIPNYMTKSAQEIEVDLNTFVYSNSFTLGTLKMVSTGIISKIDSFWGMIPYVNYDEWSEQSKMVARVSLPLMVAATAVWLIPYIIAKLTGLFTGNIIMSSSLYMQNTIIPSLIAFLSTAFSFSGGETARQFGGEYGREAANAEAQRMVYQFASMSMPNPLGA